MVRHFWRWRCPEGHVLHKMGHETARCSSCGERVALEDCENIKPDPHETSARSRMGQVWTASRGFVDQD